MAENARSALFRGLPSIDALLGEEAIACLLCLHPRPIVVDVLRGFLDGLRRDIKDGTLTELPSRKFLVAQVCRHIRETTRPRDIRLINATGRLILGGRGRSLPVARRAWDEAWKRSTGYTLSVTEAPVAHLVRSLTGAPAALLVNNGTAALLLALTSVAGQGEVIVATQHLVEIGGDVRIADIIGASGATLVEVGCTNRVHLRDYQAVLSSRTKAILFVNRPHVRTLGFTKEVTVTELSGLAREANVPLIAAEGAGVLVDLADYHVPRAPQVSEYLDHGCDAVTFSADKLIGGPQAGILAGDENLLGAMREHPLYRALRLDATTLLLLEETLALFFDPEKTRADVPLYQMLATPASHLEERCSRLAETLGARAGEGAVVSTRPGLSDLGLVVPPSRGPHTCFLAIVPRSLSCDALLEALSTTTPSVRVRREGETILLDLRTVPPDLDDLLLETLVQALSADSL